MLPNVTSESPGRSRENNYRGTVSCKWTLYGRRGGLVQVSVVMMAGSLTKVDVRGPTEWSRESGYWDSNGET